MSEPSFDASDEFTGPSDVSNAAPPPSLHPPVTATMTKARRKAPSRKSTDTDDFINMLHGSDPVRVELNRLENEVRDKDRELGEAQAEIKALRLSERAREKACEELTEELERLDEKLKLTEDLLETRNLEIKKINDEKKGAMAAQFAAEATFRRVHAAQKDDDMPPIEAILAPLEAELKIARQEASSQRRGRRNRAQSDLADIEELRTRVSQLEEQNRQQAMQTTQLLEYMQQFGGRFPSSASSSSGED